jgi:hypothetical protein
MDGLKLRMRESDLDELGEIASGVQEGLRGPERGGHLVRRRRDKSGFVESATTCADPVL